MRQQSQDNQEGESHSLDCDQFLKVEPQLKPGVTLRPLV